ncbi:hypothetical protein [Puniceibacterium confluentis]|uniref:hypothetical protein n=1 Tax=Puniceibacterium confluentis TaxID=1958944 RepID=UPI0011B40648|nr:hypothetical protein [Puniceibacterium confluentis]
MRFTTYIAAAATALMLSSGAALAWGDMYMGDGTNNPNSNMLVHTFPSSANYCPAGLQPVTVGGQICCGVPTAGAYINRAGGKRMQPTPVRKVYHAPRAYAPIGEKGVIYR